MRTVLLVCAFAIGFIGLAGCESSSKPKVGEGQSTPAPEDSGANNLKKTRPAPPPK